MNATLPKTVIAFRTLAASFIARAERGIAILIVKETGTTEDETYTPVETSIQEVTFETDLSQWSDANSARVADMLAIRPAKAVIVTIDTTTALTAATGIIEQNYQNGRVTIVGTAADYTALATWAKAKECFHVLTFGLTSQDSRYVENVYEQNITWAPEWDGGRTTQGTLVRTTTTTVELLPMIAAILSRANVNGASSTVFDALTAVVDLTDPDAKVNGGNIILYNDWRDSDRVVRLGTAVNTLTMFDTESDNGDRIEDMRYIEVSETADMIRGDITAVFRDTYVGEKKNSVDNQMQFLGAVADYFDRLAEDEILNNGTPNTVDIDVDAQREAWKAYNPEAAGWDDETVRAKPFKRKVFITSSVQILQSMQDLNMRITLN